MDQRELPTWTLAIESSLKSSSVALFEHGELCEIKHCQQDTSRNLVPLIRQLFQENQLSGKDLDLVAVADGPGSFTGLRIGVTMAKTIAYAARSHLVSVCSLRLLAWQTRLTSAFADCQSIVSVMDAQRQQFFVGQYAAHESCQELGDVTIVAAKDLPGTQAGQNLFTGPGLEKLDPQNWHQAIAPEDCWMPNAEELGKLAIRDFLAGRDSNLWSLKPRYIRKSAAEEKAENSEQ